MKEKIKITTGSIQETFLLPLWGRAVETQKDNPRLVDEKAVEIMEKVDYDFSEIQKTQKMSQHGWVARSIHTDRLVLRFIEKYPNATIVNIGCGMDTTFSRVDNGKIKFYELDLPDVVEFRKNFFSETDRHKSIASSFMDTEYFEQIEVGEALLFLAGGVLYYFTEKQIKDFFVACADYFKKCDFYFDSLSPKALEFAKKQVLKKGGMGMKSEGGWGLKPIKSIEKWDSRIKVISAVPIHKGAKSGVPLFQRVMLGVSDVMGVCHMVHIRIKS